MISSPSSLLLLLSLYIHRRRIRRHHYLTSSSLSCSGTTGDIAYGVPFSSVKSGLAAFESIPAAGIAQLFFFIGLMELGFSTVQDDIEVACKKEMDARGWDAKKQSSKYAIELNNG
jgi:hypothetical protein